MGKPPYNESRRNVLKKGSFAALGLATIAGTSTAKRSKYKSAVRAGIDAEAERLANNQETLELLKLLRDHNVKYGASVQTLSGETYDDAISALSNDGVSTQDFFEKGDSYIVTYHYNLSGSKYRLQSDVTLSAWNDPGDPDLAAPNDAFTLAYDDSTLQFEPDTIMYDGPNGGGALSVREYPITNGNGLVLDVDDRDFVDVTEDTYNVFLAFEVNKITSGQANYAGQYDHAWSIGDFGLVTGTLDFAWQALGISLDLSDLAVDGWTLYDAEEIN